MEWHRWSELGRWRELLVGGTNWVEGTKPKTIQSQDPSQKLWEFGECRSHEKSSPHPWLKQEATPSSYYKRMNSDPVTQWPSECVCVCVYVCVFVCLCVCVCVCKLSMELLQTPTMWISIKQKCSTWIWISKVTSSTVRKSNTTLLVLLHPMYPQSLVFVFVISTPLLLLSHGNITMFWKVMPASCQDTPGHSRSRYGEPFASLTKVAEGDPVLQDREFTLLTRI